MAAPKKLLAVLRKHLDSLNEPYLGVERRIGLPSGTIGKLLAGEMYLRLRHIALIGGVFGVSVLELFCAAYGPRGGLARLSKLFVADFVSEELEKLFLTGKIDERELATRIKNLKVEE